MYYKYMILSSLFINTRNFFYSKPKLSEEFLENKIREWIFTADDLEASSDEENREKPWDRMKNFAKSDVDGKMDITLSNASSRFLY